MKRFLALWLLATVACTPVPSLSPQNALSRANAEFSGRDVGLFFATYGNATGFKTLPDGSRSYRWISLEPGSTLRAATFPTFRGNYTVSAGDNGEIITGYCEIRIRTDHDDHIEKLTPINDSIGKFSGSMCSEIFGQSPN